MRIFLTILLLTILLAAAGSAIYVPLSTYLIEMNRPKYRTIAVDEGEITLNVNATGTVKPIQRVSIGAFVSGPIAEIFVDFNEPVEKDQLLARIDPKIYEAVVLREKALLESRRAEVERAEARLQQAENDESRASKLLRQNPNFISEAEVDQLKFARLAASADLSVAKTAVRQAEANLGNSEVNLAYTEIRSPVAGIVIDRKVDVGQTLAAQFQTPELFVVAPEMDKTMYIYASVDEADIGLIRQAQLEKQPVRFSVDAYPDQVFEYGRIREVRLSSEEQQNVVTYPVIVETPNEDAKLLPGMTANLSFQIEQRKQVVKIPNAALRFYPPNRKRVHPDDFSILDGNEQVIEELSQQGQTKQSAEERTQLKRNSTRRHVWVSVGNFLRARAVKVGISDSRYTELVEGEVKVGDLLVVGEQPKS